MQTNSGDNPKKPGGSGAGMASISGNAGGGYSIPGSGNGGGTSNAPVSSVTSGAKQSFTSAPASAASSASSAYAPAAGVAADPASGTAVQAGGTVSHKIAGIGDRAQSNTGNTSQSYPRGPVQPPAADSSGPMSTVQQQPPKPARELKVEDALLYLDQVKMEFSDKPQIYNEFLDIMKNFKAQSINTPGVIQRVKTLFRGYNKLILGFNTFLPEGEGYKIELTAEEQAYSKPGQEVPPHGSIAVGAGVSKGPVGVAGGGATGSFADRRPIMQGKGMVMNARGAMMEPGTYDSNVGVGQAVQKAGPQPGVVLGATDKTARTGTSAASGIGKEYGAGVGPPSHAQSLTGGANSVQHHRPGNITGRSGPPPAINTSATVGGSNLVGVPPSPLTASTPGTIPSMGGMTSAQHVAGGNGSGATGISGAVAANNPPTPSSQPGQMQQAHAIHYVTKIRNRFHSEPDTYRSFLKILHTYQKEQKGIKEVLEQVSQLFADHPDLLMEFTYFLPDAVQEQAKERLHRAARESEARRARMMSAKQAGRGGGKGSKGGAVTSGGAGAGMGGAGAVNTSELAGGGGMIGIGQGIGGANERSSGTKRSRSDRDSIRASNLSSQQLSAVQQNYAMQLVAAGIDDPTQMNIAAAAAAAVAAQQGLPQSKKPQIAPIGQGGGQRKQNRKKNASAAAVAGDGKTVGLDLTSKGLNSSMINLSPQHQMLLLQQQQQNITLQLQLQQQEQQLQQKQLHAQLQQQQQQRAKDSHISITAERRFFDQVKEVLMCTSRDLWQEFVKCLELFSNNALTKEDMLELVQDLFGSPNSDLFLEFKRLINNREEYEEKKSDVWYAVPLSEIDFTQCRKCTPSYRALPKDYPLPKCTERSEEEVKVLNDQWVSIPIGSEESYSFKHMRKNQYEEALFKCEDERFEIDMVIDSNMCTIRVLEPLAEEIANLKRIDAIGRSGTTASGTAASGSMILTNTSAAGPNQSSISPRFSISLDKRQFSTIHLNAIARIYGDHGEEILELLRRNPAGTIPVLLKRLKQKDQEWRRARADMNRHWSDVMGKNHYRSFDHRSFYFRQQDKKYLSTKQLVADIVTPPANPAAIASSSTQAPVKPAITAAASLSNKTQSKAATASIADLHLPGTAAEVCKDFHDLLCGMEPHIALTYENDTHDIHKDIYHIVCHAAETTLSSSNDKERLAALWRDLLRVFFNLPAHYLYSQVEAVLSSTLATSANDDDTCANSSFIIDPKEAWPKGTKVITTYGSGVVLDYRAVDGMYAVRLQFGISYMRASMVYGSEQLSINALHVIGVTPAAELPPDSSGKEEKKDLIYQGLVHHDDGAVRAEDAVRDPSKLFYGTQMCYIFMRLHHTLFVRLRVARQLSEAALQKARARANPYAALQTNKSKIMPKTLLSMDHMDAYDAESRIVSKSDHIRPVYHHFMSQVFALVEGSMDNTRFEDFCRTTLGNEAYVLFTLDKIITQLIKHLQAMANDENVNKLIGLFVYHHNHQVDQEKGKPRGVDPLLYQRHVAYILAHTMEDVFRIQLLSRGSACVESHTEVAIQHLGMLPAHADAPGVASGASIPASSTSDEPAMDISNGGPDSDPVGAKNSVPSKAPNHQDGTSSSSSAGVAKARKPSLDSMLLASNSGDGVATPGGGLSGVKVPKAVVSDHEDDDDLDADAIKAQDEAAEAAIKAIYSPRSETIKPEGAKK